MILAVETPIVPATNKWLSVNSKKEIQWLLNKSFKATLCDARNESLKILLLLSMTPQETQVDRCQQAYFESSGSIEHDLTALSFGHAVLAD